MADYNLTAGIHTISIKTHDTVTETVGVSYVSQNPQTNYPGSSSVIQIICLRSKASYSALASTPIT